MVERTANTPYVCGWTLDDECCAKLATAFATPATLVMAQACVNQAAEILYALSGRQFGSCEVAVRPCRQVCCDPCDLNGGYRWTPLLQGGVWTNISCSSCKDACSCTEVCEVRLPGHVDHITEIRLNGTILPSTEYRVDNHRRLVRLTPGECWPTCQDMTLAPDQPNTWEVIYGKGRPLPVAGRTALGALACELCKACIGEVSCLPERVTTISRQGLSMALLDPMEFLRDGRTGVYAVDLWLAAVNPHGRARHAGVYSPDMPELRSVGTSGGAGGSGGYYSGY